MSQGEGVGAAARYDARCVFCRIISGEIPSRIVRSDDRAVAFGDIRPRAPVHLLVVPREHIPNLEAAADADEPLLGHLFAFARDVAAEEGLASSGYRLTLNNGPDSGQEVFHIHLHVLGGRRMAAMG